jgi:hypothetical protein
MSECFRTVDLSQFVLPGDACARFSKADVPVDPGVPFVIVHLKTDAATESTLRLDLDKRVFLGAVGDDRVQSSASQIAQYISGVAFGPIHAPPFRS